MPEHLDPQTLAGFAQAVRASVPKIRQGIDHFLRDMSQREALEDAYEAMRAIHDAALMLGLADLDQLASAIEVALEDLADDPSPLATAPSAWVRQAVDQLELYLASLLAGDGHAQTL